MIRKQNSRYFENEISKELYYLNIQIFFSEGEYRNKFTRLKKKAKLYLLVKILVNSHLQNCQ